ncbi:DUF998 domain-containing protein [Streptomyces inhibens]|uniref:DUF998 domain-containing protein n=1 Tax=Streptomyces inhibens TaxID=2293571 RepID=UPI001EE69D42|nr:DUF998 domain-containing protein [Streptomyces inhibens]UKY47515.1 DUF998 domain-containing protein [Streptomyces inhibens]
MSDRVQSRLGMSGRGPSAGLRPLLICGVAGGPLFTVAYLAEGSTRAHYNAWRHPLSSLALGDHGWTQTLNFIVAGLLALAFAVGLRRALRPSGGSIWGPMFIGLWAIGLIGAGIFLADPVRGYPPGTPDRLPNPTAYGALHDLVSLAGFVALTAACFAFTRYFARSGERGWALYSAVTGFAFAVTMGLSSAAFDSAAGDLADLGGLIQRIALTVGWTWQVLLALHLWRAAPGRYEQPGGSHAA